MKLVICALMLSVIGIVQTQTYTNKYDNINLDQILSSERLLRNYVKCILDKGICSPDGAVLKKAIPDALQSGCSKCTEKQRNGAKKVLNYMLTNKRDLWNEIETKFDPQGTYRKKYEEEAKREGIKLK